MVTVSVTSFYLLFLDQGACCSSRLITAWLPIAINGAGVADGPARFVLN